MALRIRDFVDGRWSEGGGEPMHKVSPRGGALLSQFGVGEPSDVNSALVRGRALVKTPIAASQEVLLKLAKLIEEHLSKLLWSGRLSEDARRE